MQGLSTARAMQIIQFGKLIGNRGSKVETQFWIRGQEVRFQTLKQEAHFLHLEVKKA